MTALKLRSCLAQRIQAFINLRQISGTDYQSQARLLGYFDHFLVAQGITQPRISRLLTDEYEQSLSHLAPRTQYNRFCVVRQFCEYLTSADPFGYVPESHRITSAKTDRRPYIYSRREIQALLAAASALPPPGSLRPHTCRTLLGLLYTTGIRIGEALALNLEDFHLADQRLYIAQGKFHKARWIPLHPSTCQAIRLYIYRRSRRRPRSPDSPLLLSLCGSRLRPSTVNHTFRGLLRRCGIAGNHHTNPRIHDIRHTFAVHRLLAWYRDGQDINARLPALATYLGHVNIASTQVYLHPTAELLAEVNRRFHNHYLHNVNSQGGIS